VVKFMHCPCPITGAFLINYLSSLLRLSPHLLRETIMLDVRWRIVFVRIVFAPRCPVVAAFL